MWTMTLWIEFVILIAVLVWALFVLGRMNRKPKRRVTVLITIILLLILTLPLSAIGKTTSTASGVTVRTVRIGMELRMLHIFTSEQGLHHVYFTEPGSGISPILLGEEIFRNGQKVSDTFRENDGN